MGDQDPKRNKGKEKMPEYESSPVRRAMARELLDDGNSSAGASGALRIPGAGNPAQDAPRSAPVVNQPHGNLMGQQLGDALGGTSFYHGAERYGLQLQAPASGNLPPQHRSDSRRVCPQCRNWIYYPSLRCLGCQGPQRAMDNDPPPGISRRVWDWAERMAKRTLMRTTTGPYAHEDGVGNRSARTAGTGTMRGRVNRGRNAPPSAAIVNQSHGRPTGTGHQSDVAPGGSTSRHGPRELAARGANLPMGQQYQEMFANRPMGQQLGEASRGPPAFQNLRPDLQWPPQAQEDQMCPRCRFPVGRMVDHPWRHVCQCDICLFIYGCPVCTPAQAAVPASMDLQPPQPHHQHPLRPQQHLQPPPPVGAGVQQLQLQHQPAVGNLPVGQHGLQPPPQAHPVPPTDQPVPGPGPGPGLYWCSTCHTYPALMRLQPRRHVCVCERCISDGIDCAVCISGGLLL